MIRVPVAAPVEEAEAGVAEGEEEEAVEEAVEEAEMGGLPEGHLAVRPGDPPVQTQSLIQRPLKRKRRPTSARDKICS